MEYTTLNTGARIPKIGFGVFQIPDADLHEERNRRRGIGCCFRCVDVYTVYIEHTISRIGIRALLGVLQDLIRAFLRFGVRPGPTDTVQAMEEAFKEGTLKAIGVCNFFPSILVNFCENVEIKPAVNQVELHPFFAQPEALEIMKEYGVIPEAWAPLAEGKHGIFTDPMLTAIGAKYGKSAAQVVLRWNVQRGVIIIPKSTHVERMRQNIDVLDFELTDEEMAKISALSLDHSEIIDHFDPKLVQFLNRRVLN